MNTNVRPLLVWSVLFGRFWLGGWLFGQSNFSNIYSKKLHFYALIGVHASFQNVRCL